MAKVEIDPRTYRCGLGNANVVVSKSEKPSIEFLTYITKEAKNICGVKRGSMNLACPPDCGIRILKQKLKAISKENS